MLKRFIFPILILAVILYFFKHTEISKKPYKNTAIQDNNVTLKIDSNESDNVAFKSIRKTPHNVKENQSSIGISNKIGLDYVNAYRDWQYFENCYTDVEDFANNNDPLDTLKQRFGNSTRESQTEPTPQQNIYYQHHVDICKTLTDDVGGDNYNQIRYNLYLRFASLTPKTEEEKQLNQALKLREQLASLKLKYSYAHYPQSSLTEKEQSAINSEIQQLTRLMLEVYDGNDELSPEQVQTIRTVIDEIESLQNQLNQTSAVNQERIELAGQNINTHLNTMDSFLINVKSPDAFLIVIGELYKPEYLQKDSGIIRQIKAQTHIYDNYYLAILNNLVHPLVACSMDYPCDAQSDLVLSYCLGLKDSMFNQACGLGLEDFYFNFYIGANQLDDVNKYFNYLVNRYAN